MTESKHVRATLHLWDAKDVYANGFAEPATNPEDLGELLEAIGRTIGTDGTVVVLPGAEPHQALVIALDGPGDGGVVEGSVELHNL